MNEDNPQWWEIWQETVGYCYKYTWKLEGRLATGDTLTEAEIEWLSIAKSITYEYQKNGDKKETVTIGIA